MHSALDLCIECLVDAPSLSTVHLCCALRWWVALGPPWMLDGMSIVMLVDMSRSFYLCAAPVISFVVRCPTVLVDSGERLWSSTVITVNCGAACACVVVAWGPAGPWAPPALADCYVSSCISEPSSGAAAI